MPRPSSFARNVTTVIALLAPRLSASPPTQVRVTFQTPSPNFFFSLCDSAMIPPTSPLSGAIATLSTILFTMIVYSSSFLATAVLSSLDDPSYNSSYGDGSPIYISMGGGYWSWTNPYTVGRDLVRAALRIIQDETGGIFDPDLLLTPSSAPGSSSAGPEVTSDPSFLWRFVRRFILGLPVVGAASLIHMLFSLPLLGPIQWIARSRGSRGRGSSGSRDTAAVVIILLLAIGALR